jgi:hypothetical protein
MTSDYTVNGTERDERFDLSMQHMRSKAIDWKPVHAPCTQTIVPQCFFLEWCSQRTVCRSFTERERHDKLFRGPQQAHMQPSFLLVGDAPEPYV